MKDSLPFLPPPMLETYQPVAVTEEDLSDAEIAEMLECFSWDEDLLGVEDPSDERNEPHPFFCLDPLEG
jgi:hypothetical protein